MSLLRRVQEALKGANGALELERELKSAKERIERLEMSSVQTTEFHQRSMNQLSDRLARLEAQPQSRVHSPVRENSRQARMNTESAFRIDSSAIPRTGLGLG